jgi:hypothetical protein
VSIQHFEEKHSYSFDISRGGSSGENDLIELEVSDLQQAASYLLSHSADPYSDISDCDKKLSPVAFSLFVVNDRIRQIMKKKEHWPDRILPMVTSPFYYWSREAEVKENPQGVLHDDSAILHIDISSEGTLRFFGTGGDFCGILEGGVVMGKPQMRPIVSPTFPGPTKPVPRYQYANIEVVLNMDHAQCQVYPIPDNHLDYTFSESPRVFRNHGMEFKARGEEVLLSVNNSKSVNLRGDIIIYLARENEVLDSQPDLFHHVWMFAVKRLTNQFAANV